MAGAQHSCERADIIVKEHTGTLLEQSFLEQQGDGFTDNGRKVPRRRCNNAPR